MKPFSRLVIVDYPVFDDPVNGCSIVDFFHLADQLPEVTRSDNGRHWRIEVSD